MILDDLLKGENQVPSSLSGGLRRATPNEHCAVQGDRAVIAPVDGKANLVVVKNAAANVARGSAAAFAAVVLPSFLTRMMSAEAYGAWALVLQLSALTGYLDFGIQTAIGRFVAHTDEKKDSEGCERIVSTSVFWLAVAGAVGVAGTLVAAFLVPHIFHQLPSPLVPDVQRALVFVGVSLSIGLPCSVFNGIFIGLQRYEVPAAIVGGSKLFSAALIVLIVKDHGDIAQMGLALAAVNLASYALQYLMYRIMASRIRLSMRSVNPQSGRELFDYCLSLSVWTFAMLLVSGLDVSLVGYFQFEKVAYYATAATLITFLAGLQNAVFHVMIPSTSVLQARGKSIRLGQSMITATRYGCLTLLAVGLPLILGAKTILSLWVGPTYAAEGTRFLQVLAVANVIRLSALPYVMTLIGTGQQRLVIVTPIVEGLSNLLMSLVCGYYFGAIGVALGTLIGAFVGILGHLIYNMPRTVAIHFAISDYVREGLLRPMVCAVPVLIAGALSYVSRSSIPVVADSVLGVGLVMTAILVWRYGLVESEREKLLARSLAPQA